MQRLNVSGRQDLNLRPFDPQSNALARLRHAPKPPVLHNPTNASTPTIIQFSSLSLGRSDGPKSEINFRGLYGIEK
jgi:hypothetical protein